MTTDEKMGCKLDGKIALVTGGTLDEFVTKHGEIPLLEVSRVASSWSTSQCSRAKRDLVLLPLRRFVAEGCRHLHHRSA